jgi:CCR4-NOT transcription complex subunit 1
MAYQSLYLGVLKLIIVLLHDFPDFLSDFSLQLALFAGPKFYQLNNVILSAFPK